MIVILWDMSLIGWPFVADVSQKRVALPSAQSEEENVLGGLVTLCRKREGFRRGS